MLIFTTVGPLGCFFIAFEVVFSVSVMMLYLSYENIYYLFHILRITPKSRIKVFAQCMIILRSLSSLLLSVLMQFSFCTILTSFYWSRFCMLFFVVNYVNVIFIS